MINFAFDELIHGHYLNTSNDMLDLKTLLHEGLCKKIYIDKDKDTLDYIMANKYEPRSFPHYWFEKNSIDINLMTLDEAIDSGENFVYTLNWPTKLGQTEVFVNDPARARALAQRAPQQKNYGPWNITKYLKQFSIELIECINSGRCNLVINDAMEGHMWQTPQITFFLNSLKDEVIDPSKVIVLTQSWSYIYNDMPFRMINWPWPESIISDEAKPIDAPRHNFAKKFLCLNRYNKQDRFYFIYQMYKNNLLDEFNFSHSKVTSKDDLSVWNMWEWTDDMSEFAKTTPYFYDMEDYDFDRVEEAMYTKKHYRPLKMNFFEVTPRHRQDNYIYVVTESVFNNQRPYDSFDGMTRDTSEKTWKPLALKMPFIMSHQPFALKRLRDIGYKTFHTIWDESYDEIVDSNKRMSAIIDLVVSINNREDFVDMIESCDEIVEHNFKMLKLRSPEQDMIREVSSFENK